MNQLKLLKKPSESKSSPVLSFKSFEAKVYLMYNSVIQTFVKKNVNENIVNK